MRNNIVQNNLATVKDYKLVQSIFGKDVSYLKAKSMRLHPELATNKDSFDIPPELMANY